MEQTVHIQESLESRRYNVGSGIGFDDRRTFYFVTGLELFHMINGGVDPLFFVIEGPGTQA